MTAVSDETVDYIARYGGKCRDCADEDGICPRSGLPCAGGEKAIRHVLSALNYGLEHGFIKSAALSAPVGGPGDELRMLRERLGPRGLEVVQIEGRGHYVNEAVKAEIEKLRSADRYDHGYADGVEWAITHLPAPAVEAEVYVKSAALSAPVGEPELLLSSLHRQIKAVADHPEHYWIGKILLDVLERETGYGKKVASVVGETVDNHEAICEAAEAYVSAHRLMSAAMKDGLNVQGALSAIVAADEQLRAFYTHPPAPAVGAEDVARAANWKLVDGTMTTGESVIFDGSFIVAKVTRRQDAELILSLLSGPTKSPAEGGE